MRLTCPGCSKTLQMSDQLAGKQIRCPNCKTVIQTPSAATASAPLVTARPVQAQPTVKRPVAKPVAKPVAQAVAKQPSSELNPTLPDPLDLGALSTPPLQAPLSTWQPPVAKRGSKSSFPIVPVFIAIGAVVSFALIAVGGLVAWRMLYSSGADAFPAVVSNVSSTPANPSANANANPTAAADSSSVKELPLFPELGTPKAIGNVDWFLIDLAQTNSSTKPGFSTRMRIYLPRTATAAHSIPCVLVAPAGTNMLTGADVDASDYHDESLPYAQAGMAVILYSLDGPMPDPESFRSEVLLMKAMTESYLKFKAAEAGLTNGQIALEYALQKLPQVDPDRIYVAGHSSAGTLALQMLAHEPRIAKCAAYAPCSDVMARYTDVLGDRSFLTAFPGIQEFIQKYSPNLNIRNINQPVFLFHARDDSNVAWQESKQYSLQLQSAGKNCTFESVPTGDHYTPMIEHGIPKAIAWFQK